MSQYSDYTEIKNILTYRTSNLGNYVLDNTLAYNVFSYIDPTNGIAKIPVTTSLTSLRLNENELMNNIIFNDDIINYNDPLYTAVTSESKYVIDYILDPKSSAPKYKLGDFSTEIKNNCYYYNDYFKYSASSSGNDIIDIDATYYASQNIIKFLFLLDILSELYRIISENNTNKESIIEVLKQLRIKCRYNIYASEKAGLYKNAAGTPQYYTIDLIDLSTINLSSITNIVDKVSIDSDGSTTYKNYLNTFINANFISDLRNHLQYIKKADMIYAKHFKYFYKLCRLILNYNILYCLQYLVAVNAFKSSTSRPVMNAVPTYNNNPIDIIYFRTGAAEMNSADSYNYYKSHIAPNFATKTYITYYSIKKYNASNYIDGYETISVSEAFNNRTITNSSEEKTFFYDNASLDELDNYKYRIITINKNISGNYMSEPCGKIFEYNNGGALDSNSVKIKLDTANKNIIEIAVPATGKDYYIKLYNYSTLDCNDITHSNSQLLDYEWFNTTKILHIKKTLNSTTRTIGGSGEAKIYMIDFSYTAETAASPTVSGVPASYDFVVNNVFKVTGKTFSFLLPHSTLNPSPSITGIVYTAPGLYTVTCQSGNTLPKLSQGLYTATSNTTLTNKFIYIIADANITNSFPVNYLSLTGSLDTTKLITLIKNDTDSTAVIFNSFSIAQSTTDTIAFPSISPVSFEKKTHYNAATNTDMLDNYLTIVDNFRKVIENIDTPTNDTDAIIQNMQDLSTINESLNKNSLDLKRNYNNLKDEQTKVLSSNTLDIIVIILFVITLFSALYLPITSFDKNTKIIMSGSLFCLVLIIFVIIYIIIYTQYNELFSIFDSTQKTAFKIKFKDILKTITNNMHNDRSRISQKIILPALNNEKKYFEDKDKKFKIYKTISLSDYRIEKRTRLNNINRITFLLHITLIIASMLILYILLPEYWQIILAVFIILIIFALLLYYIKLVNVVHTNPNNIYWFKPETSLEGL